MTKKKTAPERLVEAFERGSSQPDPKVLEAWEDHLYQQNCNGSRKFLFLEKPLASIFF